MQTKQRAHTDVFIESGRESLQELRKKEFEVIPCNTKFDRQLLKAVTDLMVEHTSLKN